MTPRKPATEAVSDVGDAIQRAVVISTDRLQSVLEDAVVRGRMTRRDAEEIAANLIGQAQELRGGADAFARALPGKVAEKTALPRKVADRVGVGAARRRRRATGTDTQASYIEHQTGRADVPRDPSLNTARELIELTPKLSPAELAILREREVAGKHRPTVLKAIEDQLRA